MRIYKHLKRAIDFTCSLIFLIALFPLFLLVSIVIFIDNPGPAIFTQDRVGYKKNVLRIYKFRTMVVNAEKSGSGQYSFKGDNRVTRVGRILRILSIDELTQLDRKLVFYRAKTNTNIPWKEENFLT